MAKREEQSYNIHDMPNLRLRISEAGESLLIEYKGPSGRSTRSQREEQRIGQGSHDFLRPESKVEAERLPDTSEKREILDAPANEAALSRLCQVVKRRRSLAFVGAGCSIPLGYPSWPGLVDMLLDRCLERRTEYADYFRSLRSEGRLLMVAEECKSCLQDDYFSFLAEVFGPREPYCSKEHETIMSLPFAHYLTSNYDPCLEHAYGKVHSRAVDSFTYSSALRLGRFISEIDQSLPVIFYVHGHHSQPEGIVLTERDYQKHYHERGAFLETCKAMFCTHPVVFVGFSLGDSSFMNILRYLQAIFKGGTVSHFALLPYPANPPFQRQSLRIGYKIEPVFYRVKPSGDHSEREVMVKALLARVRKAPVTLDRMRTNGPDSLARQEADRSA